MNSKWKSIFAFACTIPVVGALPVNAAAPQIEGEWSGLLYWGTAQDGTKHQAVHAIGLKDGRVLCISEPLRLQGDPLALEYYVFLWTPPAIDASPTDPGSFETLPRPEANGEQSVLYASGHSQLADGRVLIVKEGLFQNIHNPQLTTYAHTFIFDPNALPSDPWTLGATMNPVTCPNGWVIPAWRSYPNCNTLGDGRVLVVGGDNLYGIPVGTDALSELHHRQSSSATPRGLGMTHRATRAGSALHKGRRYNRLPPLLSYPGLSPDHVSCHTADIPLLYDPVADSWTEINPSGSARHIPLFPNAFVVSAGSPLVFYSGFEVSAQPLFPFDPAIITDTQSFSVSTGTWGGVSPDPYPGSTSATYWPNKIIKCGGGTSDFNPAVPGSLPSYPITGQTWTIDPTGETPHWKQVAGMNVPRRTHNLVVLPDGKVFAVGGLTAVTSESGYVEMATLEPEIYDPVNDEWKIMDAMIVYRSYHSTAFLLPDARVAVAGNRVDSSFPAPPDWAYLSAQIFSPPYLFQGYRPSIVQPPEGGIINYDQSFDFATDRFINKACLIRLPAVTHAFNQDQHYVPLDIANASTHGGVYHYRVIGPGNRDLAPPGYYMLFALEDGVPSVAAMVKLQ